MNFWTIGRIQELLGDPDGWPKMQADDEGTDVWLDGYQARYTIVGEQGHAYAWVAGERMAQLFAAAPGALSWCVDTIATAQALANSYATTNETQRQRMQELQAHVNTAVQRAVMAEQRVAELESQIKKEDDLWVLMPCSAHNEMVQLRFVRRKITIEDIRRGLDSLDDNLKPKAQP